MGQSNTQYSGIFKVIGNYNVHSCNILMLPLQDFLEIKWLNATAEAYLSWMEIYHNR